ncbi:MAG: hypothetical protein MMC23_008227 [Stictis urceolatum]|nr:hypothetical protein [Stictis urceolata]
MSSKPNSKPSAEAIDGVTNPQGLLMGAFSLAFLGAVPVTTYLTKPGGAFESVLQAYLRVLLPGAATVSSDRLIPAMTAVYAFFTFAATGAFSAAGVAAAHEEGMDMNSPRSQVNNLRGLPLRLRSAHYNLMEMFPGFAVTAALAQAIAPGNQQLINLLGLHVVSKTTLYYGSYLLNIAPTRTLAHVLATGSIINVAYLLAMGAK